MPDLQKFLSNIAGFAAAAAGLYFLSGPPLQEAGPAGPGSVPQEIAVALVAPEPPKPEQPAPAEQATNAPAPPEPTPPEQAPPPPEQQPAIDPPPDDLPKPLNVPDDPDALPMEPKKAAPPPISEEAVAKFRSCLGPFVRLPPKVGKKPRPFGDVAVLVVFEKGVIVRAETSISSGTLVLDDWAASNVLRSKCNAGSESGSGLVTLQYPPEKTR